MLRDDNIRRLIDAAPFLSPANGQEIGIPDNGPPAALAFDLGDWDALSVFVGDAPPQKWLVSGAIPRGVAGIIAAAGDTGKSFTMMELCLRVTSRPIGGLIPEYPILGGLVQSFGAAVFMTAEDGRGSVHRRLRALDPEGERQAQRHYPFYMVPLPDAGGPFPIVAEERGKIVATPQFDALRERLRQIRDLALIVIDPLQCFVHADVNADPQAAALTMAMLNMVAAETSATVLVTHHVRKENESPKSAQEARNIIRGSTALVDQARFAIVLWTPDEREGRKMCKQLGADYAPNAVVRGAVVKSNDGASRRGWTLLREPSGTLRDVTDTLANRDGNREMRLASLIEAIAAAAAAGRPFTKTGQNGLYTRRAELGEDLNATSRARVEEMAQELEQAGRIVTALAIGTATKWLDIPDGQFGRGEGEFAAGAGTGQAGRKAC